MYAPSNIKTFASTHETFDTKKESHLHVPVLEQHAAHVEDWIEYIDNDYFHQMTQLLASQEHDADCECYWCRY